MTAGYRSDPDYTHPILEIAPPARDRILALLAVLYGKARAGAMWPELERLLRVHHAHKTPERVAAEEGFDPRGRFSEKDIVLITYGDLVASPGQRPLRALRDLVQTFMKGAVNSVHILPFYPYSSDRGFAVVDYEEVDPALGTWEEISELASEFRLMFDGVFNHVSSRSRWFQDFRDGVPGAERSFLVFGTKDAISRDHLKLILRPRTSELLTAFQTLDGPRWVWTTFGPDQVDLDFRNEAVLLRILGVLLSYVRRGASLVRLDAVTYIWHELGTRCAHLREGHALVQLFRAVLDVAAPEVALITETNVPHADNVSYFGDGGNEAQLVYNFALPPLVLHTFHTGDATALSRWAADLRAPSPTATFFNFLSSHDGVGLLGAEGILRPEEIEGLVARCLEHGGLVSYRDRGDGTRAPYELNTTWWSALNRETDPPAQAVARFLAARAISLALVGVPGIYLPTVFGALNDTAAVQAGAEPRAINRRSLDQPALLRELQDRRSTTYRVASALRRLARWRVALPAFHPHGGQRVLDVGPSVFGLLRESLDGAHRVVALVNVTASPQEIHLPPEALGDPAPVWHDVLTGRAAPVDPAGLGLPLRAYQVAWLTPHRPPVPRRRGA